MDRLRSFSMHRTWRWRPDAADADHYRAVETTDEGLRYFAWSHVDDGLTEEHRQSFEAFEREGPRWPLPANVARELAAWLATHRQG
jgi:hypothetical protein